MERPDNVVPTGVNEVLRRHVETLDGWDYAAAANLLYAWAGRFNQDFVLGAVTPAIRLARLPKSLGMYRTRPNSLGLPHEITVSTKHLDRPLGEVLRTLLHELLHEWQQVQGTASRTAGHNRQFREMAQSFGLIVDAGGKHVGIEPGPFTALLERYGVDVSMFLPPPPEGPAAPTKPRTRPWSCGCTVVRATGTVRLRCLCCGRALRPT